MMWGKEINKGQETPLLVIILQSYSDNFNFFSKFFTLVLVL